MPYVKWEDRCLGKGSFCEVYFGHFQRDTTERIECAIKRLKEKRPVDVLNRELQVYKALDNDPHPAFLQMFHSDLENESNRYIVFSYVPSQNLYEALIKSKKVPSIATICKIVFDLLGAFTYLARAKIVHGDTKPENILVEDDDLSVKVIDFGSAQLLNGKKCDWDQCSPNYRSPEATVGLRFDETADIWALACITAELFSKKTLFSMSKSGDNSLRRHYLEQHREVIGCEAPQLWRKQKSYPPLAERLTSRDWETWCSLKYRTIGGELTVHDQTHFNALCTFLGEALKWKRPAAAQYHDIFQLVAK